MLYWIIQITIVSFILIFLVHYLINFFKETLTIPKFKDLVNTPTQKYENMYNIISNNKIAETPQSPTNEYTEYDLLPKLDGESMKNELKNFLKQQLNNTSTDISTLDSLSSGTKMYSDF
jgi:hypothetical protein